MKPAPFDYHRPATVEEAVSLLAALDREEPGAAKVLAGGQSLVPLLSMRLAAPAHLVDINRLPGLDTLDVGGDAVRVGALARHARVEHDPGVAAALPVLAETLHQVAHPAIRNRGTVVGSLVHADPAAELPALLVLLGGVVELTGESGTREVRAAEFFEGPMQSALRAGEIAVAARFPRPAAGSGSAFLELSRRHGDYALCGVAALVEVGGQEAVTSARAALLGVGPVPVLVDLASAASDGGFDPEAVASLVEDSIDPDDDVHATATYRRHLAGVLTRRALATASSRAGEAA
ncbi:MAG TPA: xanthine dehydrogenase family protein subunit M [Nocardioidaceae bacterium]|nr:xanthine dehydrogenase family protein subunit M [Nocardioidaceae bacterium]